MKKVSCASRLEEALRIRGMRQTELSKYACIPKSAISQYISGKFEPKQDRLEILAKILNVSEAWLLGYDVPMQDRRPYIDSSLETWTVYNYEGEGTHTINIKPEAIDKLRKLLQVAGDLPPEKIDSLINVAENMK